MEIYPLVKQVDRLQKFKKEKTFLFSLLTEREKQVLALVAEGNNNPAIANKLNISRVTVQNHRANIRQKLDIKNEADYYIYALSFELITFY